MEAADNVVDASNKVVGKIYGFEPRDQQKKELPHQPSFNPDFQGGQSAA